MHLNLLAFRTVSRLGKLDDLIDPVCFGAIRLDQGLRPITKFSGPIQTFHSSIYLLYGGKELN